LIAPEVRAHATPEEFVASANEDAKSHSHSGRNQSVTGRKLSAGRITQVDLGDGDCPVTIKQP
jgi:hypothetical protein